MYRMGSSGKGRYTFGEDVPAMYLNYAKMGMPRRCSK